MEEPKLRLAGVAGGSVVNGPGRRLVVWVQGCTLGCPGCFNPATHAGEGAGRPASAVVAELLALRRPETVGVTFSGGEPFEQAEGLAAVAEALRYEWPEASLMAFSGYRLEALRAESAPAGAGRLLGSLDLLVDGPYLARMPGRAAWRASRNQRLWVLGRAPEDWTAAAEAEIHVGLDGGVLVSGFPDPRLRRALAGL